MSWSSGSARLLGGLLLMLALLQACSGFRPVYSDSAALSAHSFHYADPGSRLDQVIYTELRLRLGPASDDPDALQVTVVTSAGARSITRTNTNKPATSNAMVVSASFSVISPDGEVVASGTRSTEALYTTTTQVLGDVEASTEAAERGARALADTIRLAIIGALSNR